MFWLSQVGQARTVCCTLRGRKDTGTPEPAEHRDSGTGRTPGLRNRQDAATPERAAAGKKQMRGRPYTGTSERTSYTGTSERAELCGCTMCRAGAGWGSRCGEIETHDCSCCITLWLPGVHGRMRFQARSRALLTTAASCCGSSGAGCPCQGHAATSRRP